MNVNQQNAPLIKIHWMIIVAMSIQQLELFKDYKIMGEWRHDNPIYMLKLPKSWAL